ncbi:IS3 family transposase [Lapidilactobacillus achengensis]|uniref:IS3 family transposase n=2 Tax=Lapidilactobacillus achengensis TaxID=2486000 RepID=A0ABW1UTE0_9LACO|nr:IS3 family transposase [Lapidilactobacillus achengensis]
MYSREDKQRAIELFYQYHQSWSAVVRKLGYPSLGALRQWIRDYELDANSMLVDIPRKRKPKYSDEQRQAALNHFFEHGQFITKTVKAMGYPSRQLLREWLLQDPRCDDSLRGRTVVAKLAAPADIKVKAVEALYKREVPARKIAEDFGISRETLYSWKRDVLGVSFPTKQTSDSSEEVKSLDVTPEVSELQARIKELELQNDILHQVNALLKKDLGIDHLNLTNREKVQVIDALRDKYSLNILLQSLQLSKSSYFYQCNAIAKGDKYEAVRPRLRAIFKQNYESYGYRRMKMELADEGILLSEKVIRRLMAEEGLEIAIKRCRKYSSYAGEITPAVPNILDRNFQAGEPNQKLVTDITEFSIPAGKVYLSPLIDCFDGQITSWTVGSSPTAELVNTMLSNAAETFASNEHPIVHSDRGAHYRWPGWITLMNELGLTRSMSKKASTPDNAQAESFFGHLKTEFFYNRSWLGKTIDDFTQELNQYIEWYNTKRRKKVLGGISPQEYRQSKAS